MQFKLFLGENNYRVSSNIELFKIHLTHFSVGVGGNALSPTINTINLLRIFLILSTSKPCMEHHINIFQGIPSSCFRRIYVKLLPSIYIYIYPSLFWPSALPGMGAADGLLPHHCVIEFRVTPYRCVLMFEMQWRNMNAHHDHRQLLGGNILLLHIFG